MVLEERSSHTAGNSFGLFLPGLQAEKKTRLRQPPPQPCTIQIPFIESLTVFEDQRAQQATLFIVIVVEQNTRHERSTLFRPQTPGNFASQARLTPPKVPNVRVPRLHGPSDRCINTRGRVWALHGTSCKSRFFSSRLFALSSLLAIYSPCLCFSSSFLLLFLL